MDFLDLLESEAIYTIREVYAQFQRPCVLYSGGKDSIVLSHLVAKAFYPLNIPFPLVHIDTGHNFPETISFRDVFAKVFNAQLVVGYVQDSIDRGTAIEDKGSNTNRNRQQSVTLLETIQQYGFDACMSGARRDEEKARAKERIFSHRDETGKWKPENQRPELWNIYNGRKKDGEHFRIFPLSNWTEMDVWKYIQRYYIALPSLYYSHERSCIRRGGAILGVTEFITVMPGEEVFNASVRFRTMGDATITGAILSNASTIEEVILELETVGESERGNRIDDTISETGMEDRKKEGYF